MMQATLVELLKKISIGLFVVLTVLSPNMQLMPNYIFIHDGQRLIALVLLTVILLYSATNKVKGLHIEITKNIRYSFYLLLIFSLASVVHAHMLRHAIIEFSIFASLCYVALLTASLYILNKETFIRHITYILWASTLLYIVGFYTGYISAYISRIPLEWPQPFHGFNNIRLFNQYQLWFMAFLSYPLLAWKLEKRIRLLLSIALILWWVLFFYSSSRGVLLAWPTALIITIAVYKKLSFQFCRQQLPLAIVGFITYLVLFSLAAKYLNPTSISPEVLRSTTYDRIALWKDCLFMIEHKPVVGVGPLHYYWYTREGTHPHNSVLQLACEWGLPWTILLILMSGYAFYQWYKKFNRYNLRTKTKSEVCLSIIMFFTVIANGLYSLVDGVIVMPISQILMFMFIGIMLGQYVLETSESTNNSILPKFRPFLALCLLISLTWSNLHEIREGLSRNPRGFSSGENIVNPRIWMQPKPPS